MRQAKRTSKALPDGYARVDTPNKAFGEVLARSLTDVALLQVRRGRHKIYGLRARRGSSVCSVATVCCADNSVPCIQFGSRPPHHRILWRIAKETKDDSRIRNSREKSLHELRVGELAHLDEVSQTPSYATVDSTLLFLIAIARHVAWTGEMAFFDLLRPK